MAFIRDPIPSSLAQWRQSKHYTETDDQLEKQIRSLSKGLVEVSRTRSRELRDESFDTASLRAGAGSLTMEDGDTRVVQVIHESVREFFLRDNGFAFIDPSLQIWPIGSGHISLTVTCLDYINISELDSLVNARRLRMQDDDIKAPGNQSDKENSSPALSFSKLSRHSSQHSGRRRLGENMSLRRDRREQEFFGRISILSHAEAEDKSASIRQSTTNADQGTSGVDITRWLVINSSSAELSPGHGPLRRSTMDTSSSVEILQILEDYPALLSYATQKLFQHAHLAQKYGADLGIILARMQENIWDRWVALREDISPRVSLHQYVAELGLDSWLAKLSYGGGMPTSEDAKFSDSENDGQFLQGQSRPQPWVGTPVRVASVASFGSASSHTSSVYSTSNSIRRHVDNLAPEEAPTSSRPGDQSLNIDRFQHNRLVCEMCTERKRKVCFNFGNIGQSHYLTIFDQCNGELPCNQCRRRDDFCKTWAGES